MYCGAAQLERPDNFNIAVPSNMVQNTIGELDRVGNPVGPPRARRHAKL